MKILLKSGFIFPLLVVASVLRGANTFPSSGSAGIGTTSPGGDLEILRSTGTSPMLRLNTTFSGGNTVDLNPFITGASNGGFELALAGTQRLVINTSGNVGIGTGSPGAKLDIVGDGKWTLSAGQSVAINGAGSDSIVQGPNIYFTDTSTSGTATVLQQGASGGFGLWTYNSGWGERLHVTKAGNVGIGTTSPATTLDVVGPNPTSRVMGTSNNDQAVLSLYHANVSNDQIWQVKLNGSSPSTGAANKDFSIVDGSGVNYLTLKSGGGSVLLQPNGGNVGIGTTSPAYTLAVNGTVRAKEVIVDTGWSDYVFADDYHLQPLSEVEAHIKANRHLPGIPSAQQVEEHGISVGEMQARLLAKIEELTLHVIAQQKQLAEQKAEIKQLKTWLPDAATRRL